MTPEKIADFRKAIANHKFFSIGGDALSAILDDIEATQAKLAKLQTTPEQAAWLTLDEMTNVLAGRITTPGSRVTGCGDHAPITRADLAARDAEIAGMRSTVISDLGREIIAINTANGWNVMQPEQWADTYKVPGVLALIHSEVSEALEAFRKDDKANFIEELADVLIRVLDCSEGLGMDIEAAIRAKLEKNKGRGFRHGGKRV